MKADRKTVGQLFSSELQYIVPLFQRPYSWEKKQWEALWNDITELIDEAESKPEHFLGPLVTQELKNDAEVRQYLLIDGQQRLTTLSIILIALRERLKEFGANEERDSLLKRIERYCSNDIGGRFNYKIIPTVTFDDRDNYIALVQKTTPPREGSQLVQAFNYFLREIR
ncbi:MAG: DUF262 domain-containing protein, partial [Bacteroidia bacterium]|nr:DUF262 domain-containing protein [Bacteroidia bacterium]MDW8334213.1 DUF262 domain-containing protein [Bacteroidia bacterium]